MNCSCTTTYIVISIHALVWSDRHLCRSVECDMDTRLRLAIFHHISIRARSVTCDVLTCNIIDACVWRFRSAHVRRRAILPVVRRICHFDPHTCRGATLLGDIDLGDYNISIRAPVRVRLVVIVTVVEYVISIRVPV